MAKKEQLEELLSSLSPEQVEELESLLQKSSVTPRDTKKQKRRGKRRRKRREAAREREENGQKKEPSTAEGFLKGIKLTESEREQLEEASQADKEMGVHDPREKAVRPKKKVDTRVEMRCRVCGKTEKVSASLIPPERDRFKCNACCCSAG